MLYWNEKDVVLSILSTFLWQLQLYSFHLYYLQIFFIQSSICGVWVDVCYTKLVNKFNNCLFSVECKWKRATTQRPVFQHQRLWSFFNGTKLMFFFYSFHFDFSRGFPFFGVNALCYCYFFLPSFFASEQNAKEEANFHKCHTQDNLVRNNHYIDVKRNINFMLFFGIFLLPFVVV